MRIIYPTLATMRFGSQLEHATAISSLIVEDDGTTLTAFYPNGTKESFDTKNGTIEPYENGKASFTTSDGDLYSIAPLESVDGEWISEYKLPLPVSNLKKVLGNSQDYKNMPYLENQSEQMLAFQLPDDDYIFGILYINQYGAYMRRNGQWIEVSPSDSTFDGTSSYEVGRDKAAELVRSFDQGALKVEDAQSYLIPQN